MGQHKVGAVAAVTLKRVNEFSLTAARDFARLSKWCAQYVRDCR